MKIWLLQDDQWAIPVILAQATLSRLGETRRGQTPARARALAQAEGLGLSEIPSRSSERRSPKRERVGAQGVSLQCSLSEGPHFWARGGLAQAREDSPKRVREKPPIVSVVISPKREPVA